MAVKDEALALLEAGGTYADAARAVDVPYQTLYTWARKAGVSAKRPAVADRFWAKVDRTDGCWIWTAGKDAGGYGRFRDATGGSACAHRVAYELVIGLIPEGLELDHLCENRACVRPDHLEAVTHEVNCLRSNTGPIATNYRKTICIHGHPFSGANLYIAPDGERVCRACRAETARQFRTRHKRKAG